MELLSTSSTFDSPNVGGKPIIGLLIFNIAYDTGYVDLLSHHRRCRSRDPRQGVGLASNEVSAQAERERRESEWGIENLDQEEEE